MIDWAVSDKPVPYPTALAVMEQRATDIAAHGASGLVWLLEHPPLYTAGTSANPRDLLAQNRFPVFETGRGGQYTYHGPGQRVAYLMLDLTERGRDVRAYVQALEGWIIATLAAFNVSGAIRPGRVGVWVTRPDRPRGADGSIAEDKIAAIGVRVRRWVTLHGLSLNVNPDLDHFSGIVPCGIADRGVTSLWDLGRLVDLPEVDLALRNTFEDRFGPTTTVDDPTLQAV